MAVPKQSLSEASKLAEKQSAQYSHMYENYWSDKDAWGNYGTYQVIIGNIHIAYKTVRHHFSPTTKRLSREIFRRRSWNGHQWVQAGPLYPKTKSYGSKIGLVYP